MSFLNLIGGGRRTPAPAQPTAPTASTKSVHAQMSLPSRKDTVDSSASSTRSNQRPSKAHTVSSEPPRPSRSSTLDSKKHPRSGSPGFSPSSSEISLVETIDGEPTLQTPTNHAHPNLGVTTFSLKVSPPLEQEWTNIDTDSSDEDGFISAHEHDSGTIRNSGKNRQNSIKALNESALLVEDDEVKARRLASELLTTQEALTEMKKQYMILKQQLQGLEKENREKAMQLKMMKEEHDVDKIKTSREHATAMEAKRRDLHDLQRSIERLQRESKALEEKMEMLVRENDVLRKEVTEFEDQSRRDEEDIEAKKREVDAANTALRTFKDRSKALIGSEREEGKKLKEKADDLWRQLDALKMHSKERDEQLHHLQILSHSTDDAFQVARATNQEKDKALNEAKRQVVALEKQRDTLHHKVIEMETEVVEARNAAQRLLAKASEDKKHESSTANDRIQLLEDEVSSFSSTIQKQRASLKASRAEAESVTKLSENRALEIESLQQQLGILEDELHSKEQDLIDANAGRASQSHLEDKIAKLNVTIERLKSDHSVETHHLELSASKERVRVTQLENELSPSRERIRDLRSRLETSEQSRRMLRDQLTRREEESRKGRLPESSGASTSSSAILNLSSSIIHDPSQSPTDQVFHLLRNLNYEIFQSAALLADSLCSIPRLSTSNNNNITDLIDQDTTSLLGPYLLSLVRSQSTAPLDSYDPYPLQTAIQGTLICCATRVMTAWYPGHWDHSDFLAATYIRIREAEGISASDSWKAMTRARLRPTTTTVVRVCDFLEECLDTIFRYAGWPAVSSTSSSSSSALAMSSSSSMVLTKGSGKKSVESLMKDNREKLLALSRHSLRLNVLLDSVSPQLEPAFVEPGSVFDPYVMDGDDGVGGGRRRSDDDDVVVSTSEIGLRKVAVESKASLVAIGSGSGGSSSSSSQRRRIVLRPKVILKSTFDA